MITPSLLEHLEKQNRLTPKLQAVLNKARNAFAQGKPLVLRNKTTKQDQHITNLKQLEDLLLTEMKALAFPTVSQAIN